MRLLKDSSANPGYLQISIYSNLATSLVAFAFQMIAFGGFSLFMGLVAFPLTLIYHVTLVIMDNKHIRDDSESDDQTRQIRSGFLPRPSLYSHVGSITSAAFLAVLWLAAFILTVMTTSLDFDLWIPVVEGLFTGFAVVSSWGHLFVCIMVKRRSRRQQHATELRG